MKGWHGGLVGMVLLVLPGCGPGAASPGPTPTLGAPPSPPSTGNSAPVAVAGGPSPSGRGRGIAANAPWATLYGPASRDVLAQMAARLRLVVVDADAGNLAPPDVAVLHSQGATVISYMDVGSCEKFRKWWSTAPAGFVPCGQDTAAQRGPYAGYPDEV